MNMQTQGALQNPEILKLMKDAQISQKTKGSKKPKSKIQIQRKRKNKQARKQRQKQRRLKR